MDENLIQPESQETNNLSLDNSNEINLEWSNNDESFSSNIENGSENTLSIDTQLNESEISVEYDDGTNDFEFNLDENDIEIQYEYEDHTSMELESNIYGEPINIDLTYQNETQFEGTYENSEETFLGRVEYDKDFGIETDIQIGDYELNIQGEANIDVFGEIEVTDGDTDIDVGLDIDIDLEFNDDSEQETSGLDIENEEQLETDDLQ